MDNAFRELFYRTVLPNTPPYSVSSNVLIIICGTDFCVNNIWYGRKYVDPYNCAAVYVCALGSILSYNTCDPGLIFNETLGKCVPGKCPTVTTGNETS